MSIRQLATCETHHGFRPLHATDIRNAGLATFRPISGEIGYKVATCHASRQLKRRSALNVAHQEMVFLRQLFVLSFDEVAD